MSSRRSRSGGSSDGHHLQAVVEVLPEASALQRAFEVAVGRGDDAHVDRDRLAAAQPLDAAFLQQPQDLGLDAEGHVADLVEEDRSAVRLLDLAHPAVGRPGERPLFEPEELAFQQVLRDGDTVDDLEGLVRAQAVGVDRAGDQLLARARLAADEHGGLGRGDPADRLVDLLHGAAAPDEGVAAGEAGRAVHVHGRAHEAAGLQGLADDAEHARDVEGLEHVVESAQLGGLDRVLGRAEGRHDDDRQLGVQR